MRDVINKREYGSSCFIDLKKAFDTINHNLLIEKLELFGFRGKSREFLASYLTNR